MTDHASDCAVHSEPAFPAGTCNCPALLDAAEKPSYAVGYDDALQWVLDNIGALDDADRERIEAMRGV